MRLKVNSCAHLHCCCLQTAILALQGQEASLRCPFAHRYCWHVAKEYLLDSGILRESLEWLGLSNFVLLNCLESRKAFHYDPDIVTETCALYQSNIIFLYLMVPIIETISCFVSWLTLAAVDLPPLCRRRRRMRRRRRRSTKKCSSNQLKISDMVKH